MPPQQKSLLTFLYSSLIAGRRNKIKKMMIHSDGYTKQDTRTCRRLNHKPFWSCVPNNFNWLQEWAQVERTNIVVVIYIGLLLREWVLELMMWFGRHLVKLDLKRFIRVVVYAVKMLI